MSRRLLIPEFLLVAALGQISCSIDRLFGEDAGEQPPAESRPQARPTRLVFMQQPVGAAVATPIAPPIEVAVLDQFGSIARGFTGSLTLAMAGSGGDGELRGTLTRPAVNGTAAFSGASITREGRGYQLTVRGSGVESAISDPFDIRALPGPATLAAESGAGQVDTVGATLSQPYVVRALDSNGDPVAGVTVHWTVTEGGGQVSQPATRTDAAGRALTVHRLGETAGPQRVTATVSGTAALAAGFSASATHGTPVRLVFDQQPTNTRPGERIAPGVRVVVEDRFRNRTTALAAAITMSLVPLSGTPLATLSGTRSRTLSQGSAEFPDLSIDLPGTGYRLRAVLGALQVDSAPFDVL